MTRSLFAASLLAVCVATAASQTTGRIGFATVSVSGSAIRYRLALATASIAPQLGEQMRLHQPGLTADYQPMVKAVERHIHMVADGRECETTGSKRTPPAADGGNLLIVLNFTCASPPRTLDIRDDLSDVLGSDYRTLTQVDWSAGNAQFIFEPQARELHIDLTQSGLTPSAGSLFTLGLSQMLVGFGHLPFLLALMLRPAASRSLLGIVATFAAGHSITLAVMALSGIGVSASLVQALIALSVIYAAGENLLPGPPVMPTWVASLGFGLIHGMGFAAALRESGFPARAPAGSVLSFNLGIEAGVLIIVAVALPLLLWVRSKPIARRLTAGASVVLLATGLGPLLEYFLT